MSKYRLFGLVLLIYFIIYVIITFIDLEWMPSDPTPASIRNIRDSVLVLRDDFLLSSGKHGVLSKVVLSESSKDSFDAPLIKSLDPKSVNHKLTPSYQFIQRFKSAAKSINKKQQEYSLSKNRTENNFVLFTLINDAYLSLTLNWLCNVYALDKAENANNIHSSVLIVTISSQEKTCNTIHKDWPQVTCLTFIAASQFNEAFSWGRRLYFQILAMRSHLIAALAEIKIPFVLFETDAVWLRNPMNTLFLQQGLNEDVDLVLPLNYNKEKGDRFAFNPLLAFPTDATRRLTQELRRVLTRTPEANDQEILNNLCSTQYMGVICREFEWSEVADGKWFKMSESERKRELQTTPYIVNNNFYVGVKNKITRQALNSLWFLTPKNHVNENTGINRWDFFI